MFDMFLKDPNFLIDVFHNMRDGLMLLDIDGNIVYFNKAAEEITGHSAEEVMGKQCMALMEKQCTALDTGACTVLNEMGRQKRCDLFRQGAVYNRKCRIRARDGRSVYLLKNASVLRDRDGEIIGAVESMTDITSLYMKEMEVERPKQDNCDVVITDLHMPGVNGMKVMKRSPSKENAGPGELIGPEFAPESLIGETPAMQEVRGFIAQVSNTDFPVLISGESGAGKGAAARAIHFSGKRRNGMFFSVHCGALERDQLDAELFGNGRADDEKKGLFGEAGEGTIVLEDIDETDPLSQAKIAAFLENRRFKENGGKSEIPFGGMVIATTSVDIRKLVREGRFRQDLFFRLSMFWMRIPALRERKDDIPLLADHFLSHYKAEFGRVNLQLGREAVDVLSKHHWPGNVRELKGLIGKVCLLEEVDTVLHEYCQAALELTIPVEQASPLFDSESSLFDVERKMIEEALRKANGNMTVAAKVLNISYYTLRYRMKKFGIKSEKRCQAAKQAKFFDSFRNKAGHSNGEKNTIT